MKLMKILIDNGSYDILKAGRQVVAETINDYVSTTRKNRELGFHMYESRHSLLRAFRIASKSRRLLVVCASSSRPLVARLDDIYDVSYRGTTFNCLLAPCGEEVA